MVIKLAFFSLFLGVFFYKIEKTDYAVYCVRNTILKGIKKFLHGWIHSFTLHSFDVIYSLNFP